MDKPAIIKLLKENHQSFIEYIEGLSTEEYAFRLEGKWAAAQQLEHIVMCVKPIVYVYSMDKAEIAKNFGKTDRVGRSYSEMTSAYLGKLKAGGKAPSKYVPEENSLKPKEELTGKLAAMIPILCTAIETFSDEELDTLVMTHPLFEYLTLREMLYNVIYHVEHHHAMAKKCLARKLN